MSNYPELDKYVGDSRNNGMPDDLIRSELLKIGWPEADVESALSIPLPSEIIKADISNSIPAPIENVVGNETPPSQSTISYKKGLLIGIVTLVGLAVIASVGYFLVVPRVNTFSSTTKISQDVRLSELATSSSNENSATPGSIHVEADVKVSSDCGISLDCFNDKFLTCSPAYTEFGLGPVAVRYEILKKVSNGCQITMKYTKNPSPEWLNKDMVCTFDNKVNFLKATEQVMQTIQSDPNNCKGPLADFLRGFSAESGFKFPVEKNPYYSTFTASGYKVNYPSFLTTKYKTDGVTVHVPTITTGSFETDYNNCSGVKSQTWGDFYSREVTSRGAKYCFITGISKPDPLKDNSYSFIKKIDSNYVSVDVKVSYPSVSVKHSIEPIIIYYTQEIANTLTNQ